MRDYNAKKKKLPHGGTHTHT